MSLQNTPYNSRRPYSCINTIIIFHSVSNSTTSAAVLPTLCTFKVWPASPVTYAPSPSRSSMTFPSGPLRAIREPIASPLLYPDVCGMWTYVLRGSELAIGDSVCTSFVDGDITEAYIVMGEWTGAGPADSRFSVTPSEPTGATTFAHLSAFSSSVKCLISYVRLPDRQRVSYDTTNRVKY